MGFRLGGMNEEFNTNETEREDRAGRPGDVE